MSPKTLLKCTLNSLYTILSIMFCPFSKESRKQSEAVSGSPRCPTALIILMPCLAPLPSTATEWGVTRRGPSPCGENHVYSKVKEKVLQYGSCTPQKRGAWRDGEIKTPNEVDIFHRYVWNRVDLLSCSRGMVTREIGAKQILKSLENTWFVYQRLLNIANRRFSNTVDG